VTIVSDWLRSSYVFDLDPDLIAQSPASPRDASRLLVHKRLSDRTHHAAFRDICDHLREGDLLVVNSTRVIHARLNPRRLDTGSEAEIFLLRPRTDAIWEAMVKPGKRLRPGVQLGFTDGTTVEVTDRLPEGRRLVTFSRPIGHEWLEQIGSLPLPPYISRQSDDTDEDSYQTVFANKPGAVAAPTAGLHFTPELLARLDAMGVSTTQVVLHVGPGTFRPVRVDDVREHPMDAEYYEVSAETLSQIQNTRRAGGRIIAVGTTSIRTLETLADTGQIDQNGPASGWTRAYIYPPYEMKVVDAIITNFHLPESTLIMLVSAFVGRERTMELYREAVEMRYRFYSYGDAMLLL
jgi:S-adenosylmethionine:tRNA ribosyltransferase-isomerase